MKRDVRRWVPWITLLTDIVIINVALRIAYWLRYDLQLLRAVDPANNVPYSVYWPMAGILTVVLLLMLRREGQYSATPRGSFADEIYGILNATTTTIMLLVVIVFFYRRLFYSRIIFIYAGLMIFVLLIVARFVRLMILERLRHAGIGVDRVLIVGAGEGGRAIMRNLMAQPQLGYQIVGFLDDNPCKSQADIGPIKALGPLKNLPRAVDEYAIDQVIITLPWQYHRRTLRLMDQCQQAGVRPRVVPDIFQLSLGSVDIEAINGIPVMGVKESSLTGFNLAVKRAFDIVFSVLLGLVSLPVWLLIAAAIKLESPGPVLFKQERVGRNGKPFMLYKFRSMKQGAESEVDRLLDRNEASGPLFKIKDDPRRTRIGRIIRPTSLDEWPQLLNVLRGDMSLVGPRPGLEREIKLYQDWHRKRLEAMPGITGLWQVSGRSDLSFDEMCMLDIYYGENWSLGLDLRILVRTIPQVLFGDGAY